jgi:hypothetical protein
MHLMEGIGIALDVPGNRMFVTDLAGSVCSPVNRLAIQRCSRIVC